jgi:hypothetical protein
LPCARRHGARQSRRALEDLQVGALDDPLPSGEPFASALCAALARCRLLRVLRLDCALLLPDARTPPRRFLRPRAVIRRLGLDRKGVAGSDGGVALAAMRHCAAAGGLTILELDNDEFGTGDAAASAARRLGAAITAASQQLTTRDLWGPTEVPMGCFRELRALDIQDGGGVDAGARVLLQAPLVKGLELPEGCWEPSAALGEGYPDVPVHGPRARACGR